MMKMRKIPRTVLLISGIGLIAGTVGILGLPGCTTTSTTTTPTKPPQTDIPSTPANNFGFPLGFSTQKMDPSADPRKDFRRYAAGRWLDAAKIPADTVRTSSLDIQNKLVEMQLLALFDEAAHASLTAPKGTPLQQVGDFFAAGMDEKHLTELGVKPLQAELDQIAKITDQQSLTKALAQLYLLTNDQLLLGLQVSTDPNDRKRNLVAVGDGSLPMGLNNYLKPENKPIRDAYLKLVTDSLVIAGSTPEAAAATAAKVLAIDTRVAAKKLTPVEMQDPAKVYVRMSYADLKKLLSNVDVDTLYGNLGLPTGGELVVINANALRERNAMLKELPLADTKAYLQWELLRRSTAYLTPAFLGPNKAFTEAMFGNIELPPRNRMVASAIPTILGHPLGQVYVAKHFTPEAKRNAEDLVQRIRAEFRLRLEKNTWLTPKTRAAALQKLDAAKIVVGYPQKWIDYSSVDIRRDDYLGNFMRSNSFLAHRDLAKLGKPVVEDGFTDPTATLPTVINAAYSEGRNGIEIPAAFLQQPFFNAKADPASNYCALGAVIGHEITHGFDSQGRLYDGQGNLSNWWTDADAQYFVAEAKKLIKQADAVEVLPGLHINGQLAVGENLADVGGVSLGHAALKQYLNEHPEQNRSIDGLSQDQRCFLTWAQVWADKANEGWLKQKLPTDPHPTGIYRMLAPSQHEQAFFDAFAIRSGDPMWLPEQDRVSLW